MNKFVDIKLNDEMYSIVFGLGKVVFALAKSLRVDGYYIFEVQYDNGQRVHYTEAGKPGWCQDFNHCAKTIYYRHEVNFDDLDTTIKKEMLTKHKIEKLKHEDTLEMMSPAGGWIDASLMPDIMVTNAVNNREYELFREMKS
ncbi:MAG: hypothetical protein ACI9TV_001735 [Sulfurimonas sp.]|jgi:hypothetical protein|uniref:hypothetical protein n=1 Tax=Sulfurimonas sp. TaxID=2022749 RepID=UPI0039E3393F